MMKPWQVLPEVEVSAAIQDVLKADSRRWRDQAFLDSVQLLLNQPRGAGIEGLIRDRAAIEQVDQSILRLTRSMPFGRKRVSLFGFLVSLEVRNLDEESFRIDSAEFEVCKLLSKRVRSAYGGARAWVDHHLYKVEDIVRALHWKLRRHSEQLLERNGLCEPLEDRGEVRSRPGAQSETFVLLAAVEFAEGEFTDIASELGRRLSEGLLPYAAKGLSEHDAFAMNAMAADLEVECHGAFYLDDICQQVRLTVKRQSVSTFFKQLDPGGALVAIRVAALGDGTSAGLLASCLGMTVGYKWKAEEGVAALPSLRAALDEVIERINMEVELYEEMREAEFLELARERHVGVHWH